MYKLIGTITLLISIVLFWFDKDIFIELFNGRPSIEIQFTDLLLPIILLIIGLFFLFKKTKNDKSLSGNYPLQHRRFDYQPFVIKILNFRIGSKSKIFVLICIILSFSSKSFGQDQEVKSVSSLFEVFSKMSDNIDKLIDKQEAKRLYRHLDYFRNDMNRYLIVRKEITTYLEARNYSSFDTLRVQEAVLNLKIQIVKLGMRLETGA